MARKIIRWRRKGRGFVPVYGLAGGVEAKFGPEWSSGLGYIGSDAGKEAFIPTYGAVARQPVAGAPPLRKRLLGNARRYALPVLGAVAGLFLLKKFFNK